MERELNRHALPLSLLGLALLMALLLALVPPEQTLGPVIRPVFLHGALVEVSLLVFAAGGVLGLAYLVWRNARVHVWALAVQKTGVVLWIAYALSSMVATKLAWGEWIAWNEPRVRASALVLGFVIICLLLVLWVDHRLFTALANVSVAGLSWFLVKGAGLLRHPFDPIGASTSAAYRLSFVALLVITLLLAVQVARWLRRPVRT